VIRAGDGERPDVALQLTAGSVWTAAPAGIAIESFGCAPVRAAAELRR
jgi:hypothetical protein